MEKENKRRERKKGKEKEIIRMGILPMGGKDGQKEMGLVKERTGSNIHEKSTETSRAGEGGKDGKDFKE